MVDDDVVVAIAGIVVDNDYVIAVAVVVAAADDWANVFAPAEIRTAVEVAAAEPAGVEAREIAPKSARPARTAPAIAPIAAPVMAVVMAMIMIVAPVVIMAVVFAVVIVIFAVVIMILAEMVVILAVPIEILSAVQVARMLVRGEVDVFVELARVVARLVERHSVSDGA